MTDRTPTAQDAGEQRPLGWSVLHLFCHLPASVDAAAIELAVKSCVGDDHHVIAAAVLGHKADLALIALGPDPVRLRQLQSEVQRSGAEVVSSYFSLTELSEYSEHLPEAMKQARLRPKLPPEQMGYVCFYPMSKRRLPRDNWYELSFEQRSALMTGHGLVGRRFAGRVLQLVTGSTGLDDFEWGVTLFARELDDLKDCVYTMRFDEASYRYAEFGPFITGLIGDIGEVLEQLGAATNR